MAFCLILEFEIIGLLIDNYERPEVAAAGGQGPQDHQSLIQVLLGLVRQINNLQLMMPILSKFENLESLSLNGNRLQLLPSDMSAL